RRRHTRFSRDWSSDVCSSDLSEPIDLIAGHIPGAINIPFSENLDDKGNFLKPEILKEKYSKLLSGKPEKLIVHCGSGVTACHTRSEERRVGKVWRSRWTSCHC